MRKYLCKRILSGIFIIFISLIISFTLIHTAPGDPITILAGQDNPSPEMVEALTQKYGLDKSLPVQFIDYIKSLLKGDLGYSIISDEPVADLILEKVFPTLLLAMTGVLLAVLIGTSLGIYAARKKGSKFDVIANGISYVFDSTPGFWLGLMLILISASFLPTVFGFRTGLLSKVSGSSASRSDTASASLKKTMVPSTSIKQICEVSIIFSEALPNLFLLASVIC